MYRYKRLGCGTKGYVYHSQKKKEADSAFPFIPTPLNLLAHGSPPPPTPRYARSSHAWSI